MKGALTIMKRCLLAVWLVWLTVTPISAQDPPGSRLEHIAPLGGPLRAVVLDGVDALLAEGDSIVRVPLLGPSAFQATERFHLSYGSILDLARTPQALYGLTGSHLLILSPDGRELRRVIAGGGIRLTLSNHQLAISGLQAGVRLFTVLSDGDVTLVSDISTPTETRQAVLVNNTLLAMADRAAGLRLIDLGTQTIPRLSNALAELTPANDVASFANLVYVSTGHYIHIIDTHDPLRIVGHYAPLRDIRDMAWYDDYLLIADGVDGLKVYRAEAQDLPRYRNSQVANPAHLVAVDDSLIITGHEDGLRFYTTTSLPDLHLHYSLSLWATPTDLSFVHGQKMALVGLGMEGMAIINTGATLPRLEAVIPFPGSIQSVRAHPHFSTIIYLTLDDGRLMTIGIDATDVMETVLYQEIPLPGQPGMMAVDDTGTVLAVVLGRAGVKFFSVAHDPTQPQEIAVLDTLAFDSPGIMHIQDMTEGQWLVLDGSTVRLLHFDNRNLRELSRLPSVGAYAMTHRDQTAWVGEQNRLVTLSLSDHQIRQQAIYQTPMNFTAIHALLGQLIIAGEDGGLLLLDTADPAQPREQRFIDTDLPIERFLVSGDDWLLLHPTRGLAHLRFPLLMADSSEPIFVGRYMPANAIHRLVPLANGNVGMVGDGWYQWDGDIIQRLDERSTIDAIPFGNDVILLGSDYTPYRLGQISVSNRDIYGMALATDGQVVWLLNHSGMLYTLDPLTLDSLARPRQLASFDMQPSMMTYYAGKLLIGTHTGDVWLDDQRVLEGLGGPVTHIQPLADGNLLVSAESGGLWLLTPTFQPINHYAGSALAATTSSDGKWIALATGTCGLQILDADLNIFADWAGATITGVHFVDQELLVIADGNPTLFRFDPTQPASLPPSPRHPSPPHATEVATRTLQWRIGTDSCLPLQYEVWLNSELVGITDQTEWLLPVPLAHDLRWQIVTVDTAGNRTPGPEWHVYAPSSDWFSSPAPLQANITPPPSDDPTLPWWVFGLILAVIGVFGLLNILRRESSA